MRSLAILLALALAGCGNLYDVIEGRCSVQQAFAGVCVREPWVPR